MSASSSVIARGLRRILQAVRLVSPRPVPAAAAMSSEIAEAAPLELSATIEIVSLIDSVRVAAIDLSAIEVVDGAAHAPTPQRRAAVPRPLALQLAYTASRNVPKGRKAHPAPLPVSSGKRTMPSIKARPVVQNTVKKAPKRRHVWLCNQARVIRPIGANVVALNAPRVRSIQKPGAPRTARLLKLAA